MEAHRHYSELKKYVEVTKSIRDLSNPSLDEIKSADNFRAVMIENFSRIGELSRINTDLLNQYY